MTDSEVFTKTDGTIVKVNPSLIRLMEAHVVEKRNVTKVIFSEVHSIMLEIRLDEAVKKMFKAS